ncbi:transposase [Amycolatopsis pithecellobii]|uniref:transposase n=1 Tax=Amycolatopsis pithecellobii TaxID=664692 RepID=UPI001AA03502|nr:transposase [Amycolatopsis pithecellobii]
MDLSPRPTAVKAARVLDLYARVWEGEPLGENDFVLSADEKPGVQARYRKHHPLPAGPRIVPFSRLVDQVMTSEPYASARRVFWIVDNGASHRNWPAAARLNDAFSHAHMIHLPVHASWLNQVEIYFSAVQRKALTPDDFYDLNEVEQRLLSFHSRYNTTARPFGWTFTRHDLNQLLTRIGRHDRHAPQPLAA